MDCVCEMIGLACGLAIILKFSPRAAYQIKMVTFLLASGGSVLLCMPLMLFRPRDYRNALIPAWCCRQFCRALGVTMEIRGLENVRKEHGSVVLMNHQSILDLCVLAHLWPVIGRATVVSKKEILYLPFFGFGAWLWGTLFIDRSRKKDSINTLMKESLAINERNCKLLLFPEGTRNSKETLLPFKKGSFHIALRSRCPIQPVVISKYWFLDSENKSFNKGHAIIHILPEISIDEYSEDDLEQLGDVTRNIMDEEYKKLSQEAKNLHFKI